MIAKIINPDTQEPSWRCAYNWYSLQKGHLTSTLCMNYKLSTDFIHLPIGCQMPAGYQAQTHMTNLQCPEVLAIQWAQDVGKQVLH